MSVNFSHQSHFNYIYNHDFVGCVTSLQRDQYLLTCEVRPRFKREPECYIENFFENGVLKITTRNKGKFPTQTEQLQKKMYFYKNKVKEKKTA